MKQEINMDLKEIGTALLLSSQNRLLLQENLNNQRRIKMNYNSNNIELIMGWDIGDGETAACAMQVKNSDRKQVKNSDRKIEELYICPGTRADRVIPSIVFKQKNGEIITGYSVENNAECAGNFAINFKRSPETWDADSPFGMKYNQHMFDFIRGVSEAILENNNNRRLLNDYITFDKKNKAFWNIDKVLLVVGCPAADNWKNDASRDAYEKLIAGATGIKNVIVAEESRAAIFSLFEKRNKSQKELQDLNYQNGVLVLDFGSSTADASCIVPGEKQAHLSWNLGAAEIEKAMLEYIEKSPKTTKKLATAEENYRKEFHLDSKNVPEQLLYLDSINVPEKLLNLRKYKEDYYSKKTISAITVDFEIVDKNNDPIIDEFGDRVRISIQTNINDDMMKYATGIDTNNEYITAGNNIHNFKTTKDNTTVCDNTWAKTCEAFMQDVKIMLNRENIRPDTVVLTGGGSNMKFVEDIAKKVFPKNKVIHSANPSHSVVSGLNVIGFNVLKEEEIRKNIIDSVKQSAKSNMNKMLDDISNELASNAYNKAIAAVENIIPKEGNTIFGSIFDWGRNVGDINRTVTNALNGYLNKDNILAVIKKYNTTRKNDDAGTITKIINNATQDLYADQSLQSMVMIKENIVGNITGDSLSLEKTIANLPDIGKDSNIVGKIVTLILDVVITIFLCILLSGIPIIGPVIGGFLGGTLGEGLGALIKENSSIPVPLGALKSSLSNMKRDKSNEIAKIKVNLRIAIRETLTNESAFGPDFKKYYDELEKVTNKATDRIFFIV